MCAREDGIRGSKDLRAEIGKFPNSTNERKQMSTKTMKQRIAVVAVSALTAGILSVMSAPVSMAAPTANSDTPDFDTITMATNAANTGSGRATGSLSTSGQTGYVTVTSSTGTANTSGGIDVRGGGSQTADVLPGAQIPFQVGETTASLTVSLVVTGGTLSSAGDAQAIASSNASAGVAVTVNAAGTVALNTSGTTTTGKLHALVTAPTTLGATVNVAAYQSATSGAMTLTNPTNGTLIGMWTLRVVSASAVGSFNAANSTITTQVPIAKGVAATGVLTYDNTSLIPNGNVGLIYVKLLDAYLGAVTSTSNTLAVATSPSAGAKIYDTASAADSYGATSSFHSISLLGSDGAGWIYVNQPTANTASSTTVTISLNGAVIATKTLKWAGDIASITVDTANSKNIFLNGATATNPVNAQGGIRYVVKDAAGNALTIAAAPTLTGATGALVGASLTTDTATTSGTLQTSSNGYGTTTMVIPSSTLQGAGTYKLRVSNSAGVSIDSPVVNATVSNGGINSFAVSWDKATYVPGDIATLTITAKDEYGNSIDDGAQAIGLALTVNTSGFTAVGSACTALSAFAAGKITCQYSAGNTEGAYSYSIDLTTITPQSASVGAAVIKASAATVSNADVLKSIVSLIASINKQIQALQKLILARR